MTDVRITHIGGPTTLIEVGGWRLLTDPTFDDPGRRYSFGWGTASRKLAGPALSHPIVGDVIGFALSWDGQEHGVLWISGDTVLYDGVRQVAERLQVDIALLHLGGVRFPVTGPLRYTMTAKDAVELCRLLRPRIVIPIHYEGWKHFRQGRDAIERELARAPDDVRRRVRWLPIGVPFDVAAGGSGSGA